MVKILSLVFFLLFLVFAALQYNDPDPVFWMVIYLVIAFVSFSRLINKSNKKVILVVLVVLTAISLMCLPGFIEWLSSPDKDKIFGEMQEDKKYIEESREFIGLLMGIAIVFYQYRQA